MILQLHGLRLPMYQRQRTCRLKAGGDIVAPNDAMTVGSPRLGDGSLGFDFDQLKLSWLWYCDEELMSRPNGTDNSQTLLPQVPIDRKRRGRSILYIPQLLLNLMTPHRIP
jgi:hypothetical protein